MKIYRQIYKKNKKFKRHFQLLEVMIAVFILLVCAAPAMQIYTSMFKGQQAIVRENQRDHLARLIHAKITEQLYKRAIPVEQFLDAKQTPVDFPELEQKLKDLSYKAYYCVANVGKTPKGEEKPGKYLVQLVITIRDISSNPPSRSGVKQIENQDTRDTFYDYLVYIDAGGGNKKNEPKNSDQKQEIPSKPGPGQSATSKAAKDNS